MKRPFSLFSTFPIAPTLPSETIWLIEIDGFNYLKYLYNDFKPDRLILFSNDGDLLNFHKSLISERWNFRHLIQRYQSFIKIRKEKFGRVRLDENELKEGIADLRRYFHGEIELYQIQKVFSKLEPKFLQVNHVTDEKLQKFINLPQSCFVHTRKLDDEKIFTKKCEIFISSKS